jgi:PAS domain S-box-containing protein
VESSALRRRAEKRFEQRRRQAAPDAAETDPARLVEDLRIHQFELEIQNEDLQLAHAELDALLRKYRALYDGAPVGFLSVADDGVILECNPAGAALLELDRSRLPARRFADFVAPDSRAAVSGCLSEASRTSSKQACEALLLTSGQGPLHVQIEAAGSGEGRPCQIALVDVTERRRAEAALEASEVRYRRLFESSRDGILLLDAGTGEVLAVNPSFCRLLGCPAETFLGKPLWEIGPLSSVAGSRQAFIEQQGRGDVRLDQLPIETEDGRHLDVELVSHTYREAHGHVMQIGIRDIGERLHAERALEEMEERLELSRRLEAVGRLAGGVAHEFNNQLGVILGFVELLQRDLPPQGPERQKLEQIETAARYSADLTRQLLAFARKQVLRPRLLAPSELVAGAAPRLSQKLGPGVDLALELNATGRVQVDPDQLEGALMALASNACDAMPEGGALTIETEDVDLTGEFEPRHEEIAPARYVTLTVSDTGRGLDAAARSRVFEPFFSTKRQAKGTGLSLAAVYGTVKQSGGYLFVESDSGPGASFRIYLPVEEAPPGDEAPDGETTSTV